MTDMFEQLFKSEEEIKRYIIQDFALELLSEVNKLVELHGKDHFFDMLRSNQ